MNPLEIFNAEIRKREEIKQSVRKLRQEERTKANKFIDEIFNEISFLNNYGICVSRRESELCIRISRYGSISLPARLKEIEGETYNCYTLDRNQLHFEPDYGICIYPKSEYDWPLEKIVEYYAKRAKLN